jgi:hypothetical protein
MAAPIRNEDGLARCLATYPLVLQDLYQNARKGMLSVIATRSTPTGKISDPVLALNPIGDPVVPIESASYYAEATGRAGTSHLFALMWVEAPWAIYQVEQVKRALELLTDWITQKKRPEPGELKVSATAGK